MKIVFSVSITAIVCLAAYFAFQAHGILNALVVLSVFVSGVCLGLMHRLLGWIKDKERKTGKMWCAMCGRWGNHRSGYHFIGYKPNQAVKPTARKAPPAE